MYVVARSRYFSISFSDAKNCMIPQEKMGNGMRIEAVRPAQTEPGWKYRNT